MERITIHKGEPKTILVNLGMDVSSDKIIAEIRAEPAWRARLLATWDVSFVTDGRDGELRLSLNAPTTESIKGSIGYLDMRRIHDGESYDAFEEPLEVMFT